MKTITSLLILAACHLCFAGSDINIIAMSDWSKPVSTPHDQTLRGRMILAQGDSSASAHPYMEGRKIFADGESHTGLYPDTEFYLELQNVTDAFEPPMQIYFDPAGLHCEMLDSNGKPPTGGIGYGSSFEPSPDAFLITLPHEGAIRLRVGMHGYGAKPGDSLRLALAPDQGWDIRPGNTNDYFMSGTFTVAPPTNSVKSDIETQRVIWSGTLELPKMKVWVGKP